MHPPNLELSRLPNPLARYPLLTALRERRSRRFGLGMKMPAGPLTYQSSHQPAPLSEEAEAALVFAACGITGHALADLCYAKGEGGNIMAGRCRLPSRCSTSTPIAGPLTRRARLIFYPSTT